LPTEDLNVSNGDFGSVHIFVGVLSQDIISIGLCHCYICLLQFESWYNSGSHCYNSCNK